AIRLDDLQIDARPGTCSHYGDGNAEGGKPVLELISGGTAKESDPHHLFAEGAGRHCDMGRLTTGERFCRARAVDCATRQLLKPQSAVNRRVRADANEHETMTGKRGSRWVTNPSVKDSLSPSADANLRARNFPHCFDGGGESFSQVNLVARRERLFHGSRKSILQLRPEIDFRDPCGDRAAQQVIGHSRPAVEDERRTIAHRFAYSPEALEIEPHFALVKTVGRANGDGQGVNTRLRDEPRR